jgi:hypothetical protein
MAGGHLDVGHPPMCGPLALSHFFCRKSLVKWHFGRKSERATVAHSLGHVAHSLCPLDLPEKSPLFSSLQKNLASKLEWGSDGYGREKRSLLAVPSHDPAQHLDHLGLADLVAFGQIAGDLADGAVLDDFQRHAAFGRLGA